MRRTILLGAALLAGPILPGAAHAANQCRTDGGLRCATTMPVGGYCECKARGDTQSGTVAPVPARGGRTNAGSGGCGAQPNAPGCR